MQRGTKTTRTKCKKKIWQNATFLPDKISLDSKDTGGILQHSNIKIQQDYSQLNAEWKKSLKQFPLNSGTRHKYSLSLYLSNKILNCFLNQ